MTAPGEPPWRRLAPRMIAVDAAQTALSLAPAGLAFGVLRVEPTPGRVWPVVIIAAIGVIGAGNDALRWVKTRYRITGDRVERRTGLLVRRYRSIRRDRIRTVDTTARLRHRLAGLRQVRIGAGQQEAAGESALVLDAVDRRTAAALRHDLLGPTPAVSESWTRAAPIGARGVHDSREVGGDGTRVLARIRWSWLFYNIFNAWAFLAAAGTLWGAHWLAGTFGLDLIATVTGGVDWQRLGWGWGVPLAVAAVAAFGAVVLAVSFVAENWRFTLARVDTADGTVLRTTQGLFKTREVNRDDHRLRGLAVSEPVLWRWMGMADTNVISTGLVRNSLTPATTILPRGPIAVARAVAAAVLAADPDPLTAPLHPHPAAARRRRLWWAAATTAVVAGLLAWLAATVAPVPGWAPLAALALAPVAAGAATIAYRALGHTVTGDYLVVRAGVVSRTTAALQRRAVAGLVFRSSPLQRRLGLMSVTATTAAGDGGYEAKDLTTAGAVGFAHRAAPGLLTPFLAGPVARTPGETLIGGEGPPAPEYPRTAPPADGGSGPEPGRA